MGMRGSVAFERINSEMSVCELYYSNNYAHNNISIQIKLYISYASINILLKSNE